MYHSFLSCRKNWKFISSAQHIANQLSLNFPLYIIKHALGNWQHANSSFIPNVSLIRIFHEMLKYYLKIGEKHIPSSITFGPLVDRLNRRICVGCIIQIISSMVCVIIYITFKSISLHSVLNVKCCFICYYQPKSVSNCPNPLPLLDQWDISENSVRDPNE